MNRLTMREDSGVATCAFWNSSQCGDRCDSCDVNDEMLERLAKYEETRLTPDDIDSMVSTFVVLTSAEYGKQRFFQQEDGTWYDRDQCDYIKTRQMILRAYNALNPHISEDI